MTSFCLRSPLRRRGPFLAALLLGCAWLGRSAAAQDPFIFDERLYNAPDAILAYYPVYAGGSIPWSIDLQGGDLDVLNGKFQRFAISPSFLQSATISTQSFPPFLSNAWVYRAEFRGTSFGSSSPGNAITLAVGAGGASYGCRVLINRSDFNNDFNFGDSPAYNDLFNDDLFAVNTLPNRDLRLTFVDKGARLYAFLDDLNLSVAPTTFMKASGPSTGTLNLETWDRASVILGSRFTGSVDNIQFYNVSPYIESFSTTAPLNLAPTPTLLDNTWTVLDSNNPTPWGVVNGELRWQSFLSTVDPAIKTESPETDFISASWHLDATIKFYSPSNLPANRLILELQCDGMPPLGIVIPRVMVGLDRLRVYSGTEANVVAGAEEGSDIVPSYIFEYPYRVSMEYNQGELVVHLNDRKLVIGAAQLGYGSRHWRRLVVRGDKDFAFSIDNILFHNTGRGQLAAPDEWALYE